MVMVLPANAAVTPPGKPVGVPMPVAPVVVCVMDVRAVLIQSAGEDEAVPTVLRGFTVKSREQVLEPPPSVTVTVYVPPTLMFPVFCPLILKPPGPSQE